MDGSDADLEPGRYPLRELYCTDASCDCQRVTLYVLPHDVGEDEDLLHPDAWPEATISFSWADDAHLQRWMGDPKMSPQDLELLRGPLLDVDGLQGPGAEALLALFRTQLLPDPAVIARLARHYDVFRAAARSELERPGGGWFEVGEVREG